MCFASRWSGAAENGLIGTATVRNGIMNVRVQNESGHDYLIKRPLISHPYVVVNPSDNGVEIIGGGSDVLGVPDAEDFVLIRNKKISSEFCNRYWFILDLRECHFESINRNAYIDVGFEMLPVKNLNGCSGNSLLSMLVHATIRLTPDD